MLREGTLGVSHYIMSVYSLVSYLPCALHVSRACAELERQEKLVGCYGFRFTFNRIVRVVAVCVTQNA